MDANWRRTGIWLGIALATAAGLVLAFRPQPIPVDIVTVNFGPLMVTVDEEGETRVRDAFIVSAPVTGRARRIEADVGDTVVKGETVLAEIEPIDPAFLDPRSEAQAHAALRVAEANRGHAVAGVQQAEAEHEFAVAEVERARQLIHSNAISERALDEAERRVKTAAAALGTARASLRARESEYLRAEAELMSPVQTQSSHGSCECIPLTAPVSGTVLRVLRESEGVVSAGTALVEIGDPNDLEIVTDYLSPDAVRIRAGLPVLIENWGGEYALEGRVRRVEPFAYTKVSALGIEEQRANVVIDFDSPPGDREQLGHGYRVETRIILWSDDRALKIPLTALFREGNAWAVFVVQENVARLRELELGGRNGIDAEVRAGLEAGEQIIATPSDRIAEGVRVVAR